MFKTIPAVLLAASLMAIISTSAATAQVSGHCFLGGQTDHSGTSVVFVAASPGAQTDSTLTDPAGAYSLSLLNGLYQVGFRHTGYLPQDLPELTLVGLDPLAMADVTLQPGQIIELSGYTGNLHLTAGTIARITGLTRVGSTDSLIVDPGVRFQFAGYQTLIIEGYARFNGTAADSIVFESETVGAGPGAWAEISIRGADVWMRYCSIRHCSRLALTSTDPSVVPEFDHCLLASTKFGVDVNLGATFQFRDCIIRDANSGLATIQNTSGPYADHLFQRCVFRNTLYQNTTAVKVSNTGTARLDACIIDADDPAQTHGYGLQVLGNCNVEALGCSISDCLTAGVNYQATGSLRVESCLIAGNGAGLVADQLMGGIVRGNTIVGNAAAGVWFGGGGGEIDHNILWGNGTGLQWDGPGGNTTYNDIFGNGVDFSGTGLPPYFGQLSLTNANGDPSDVYLNILLDPAFVDTTGGDFGLQATSPCIDAGDPARLDPDGTTADLGAFFFDQSLSSVPVPDPGQQELLCSPNPFNPVTTIRFTTPEAGRVNLELFDPRGRRIRTLLREDLSEGNHRVTWDGTDDTGRPCPSGTYLMRLVTTGNILSGKMLLAK